MKLSKYILLGGISMTMGLASCVNDLNVEPTDPNTKTSLNSRDEYMGLMARAYGGLVMEGGISVDDGGAGVYTRQLFNQQELPTDECVICGNWDDAGISELVYGLQSPSNHWGYEMFSRINFQIALCNEFIREIANGGEFFTDAEIAEMQAEARVLRDLSYYHMIDIFGRGPWTDESSLVGATPPTLSRPELYNAIVTDLVAALPQVNPAAQQEYGRVSREAGYALLAKLYLNAEVYTGTPAWAECAAACQEILKTINTLAPEYKYLFCGDNHQYVASSTYGATGEILWSVPQNELTMQTYGGTTYLSGGAYSQKSDNTVYGLFKDAWQGPHMRPETVLNFTSGDKRALFWEGPFTLNLDDISIWGNDGDSGWQCVKFVYTPSTDYYNEYNDAGQYVGPGKGSHGATDIFNSADVPLFRLADIFLMLAECEMNGVACNGLEYYNKVLIRAGLGAQGSLPNKKGLLDERNRELYWECHRRTDMIRLGYYTGSNYNWQWKSGIQQGSALPEYRNLMPIPSQFVPTLGQNPGF